MKLFFGFEEDYPIFNYKSEAREELNEIENSLEGKWYGEGLEDIGFISIILRSTDDWQERVLYKKKTRSADVRLYINYEDVMRADYCGRKFIYANHILLCLERLKQRVLRNNTHFRYDELIEDIYNQFLVRGFLDDYIWNKRKITDNLYAALTLRNNTMLTDVYLAFYDSDGTIICQEFIKSLNGEWTRCGIDLNKLEISVCDKAVVYIDNDMQCRYFSFEEFIGNEELKIWNKWTSQKLRILRKND